MPIDWDKAQELSRQARKRVGEKEQETLFQGIVAKDLYVAKIPFRWLAPAGEHASQCIGLAMYLWLLWWTNKRRPFELDHRRKAPVCLSRKTLYNRLNQLCGLGMVRLERKRGKAPRITIILSDRGCID